MTQLPADLQKVGKEAEGKLDQQFDQLSSEVDNKQASLVDSLADKYVSSRDQLDSRIEELKAANKGLVDKALDAVVGVIKTILQLKDMLLGVLSKAAGVIGDIITDPIEFLGNLIGGIKEGLSTSSEHRHPSGKRADGLAVRRARRRRDPAAQDFDLTGILSLIMEVLGLTLPQHPRPRRQDRRRPGRRDDRADRRRLQHAGHRGHRRPVGLDQGQDRRLRGHGPGRDQGLHHRAGSRAGSRGCSAPEPRRRLHQGVQDDLRHGHVLRRARLADHGVRQLRARLDRRHRPRLLSAAAEKVESALAKALPLAISFLASLLGLGGITEKIKEGIDKVRTPIEKAVDFVVLGAVKGFKKLFGGAIGWVKGKYEKGKQWATAKVEAWKTWVKGKAQSIKDRFTGGSKDAEDGTDGAAGAQKPPKGRG